MNRFAFAVVLGSLGVIGSAAAQTQSEPAGSMQQTPSSTEQPSTQSPATSPTKPATGHHDTSRGAKEQQSQKKKCPKNGDKSNVNCKETAEPGNAPK